MMKSTLFHSFLIIALFYSFNNNGHVPRGMVLRGMMRSAANRGLEVGCFTLSSYVSIAVGYAIKNSIRKTADPSFIRALKPAIIFGSGLTLLDHVCDSFHRSSHISQRSKWFKATCALLIPGLTGIGATTYPLWQLNKWVIKRHENNQKIKAGQD